MYKNKMGWSWTMRSAVITAIYAAVGCSAPIVEGSDNSSGSEVPLTGVGTDLTSSGTAYAEPTTSLPQTTGTGTGAGMGTSTGTSGDSPCHIFGDECESTGPGSVCGDDSCDGEETPDSCYVDCGFCGNGKVEGPEECDDGDLVDDNMCRNDCTKGCFCGDGILCGSEECDEGSGNNNNQTCLNSCKKARCGDGYVQDIVEWCDDGNDIDTDNCSSNCDVPRYVFLTSTWTKGGNLGGLEGADALCMERAAKGMLILHERPFKAWVAINNDATAPITRIRDTTFSGWYKLADGTLIARGWDGLTGPEANLLINTITLNEYGVVHEHAPTWTNVDRYGRPVNPSKNCVGWTSSSGQLTSWAGFSGATTVDWTAREEITCGASQRIYCFEVR